MQRIQQLLSSVVNHALLACTAGLLLLPDAQHSSATSFCSRHTRQRTQPCFHHLAWNATRSYSIPALLLASPLLPKYMVQRAMHTGAGTCCPRRFTSKWQRMVSSFGYCYSVLHSMYPLAFKDHSRNPCMYQQRLWLFKESVATACVNHAIVDHTQSSLQERCSAACT
jgi:hypothetical protein